MSKAKTLAEVVSNGGVLAGGGDTITDPILILAASAGSEGQVPVSQGAGLPLAWGDRSGAPSFILMSQGVI